MAVQKARTNKKSSGIGVGLAVGTAIGAAAGAVAALLLSPKSGKQNRAAIAKKVKLLRKKLEDTRLDERVKDTFGEVTDETRDIYVGAKEALVSRLAELKDSAGDIDLKKYTSAVDDVVAQAKKKLVKEAKKASKLKDSLMGYFPKVGTKKKAPAKKRTAPKKKVSGRKKPVAKKPAK